ncbi:MAG: sensor histidine kinase [Coriobacteriales bacterium]|nr:sensor histidine kinase [Coriobacteriales bacterium]
MLENAVKYVDEGGSINVSLHAEKDSVRFAVENSGPGIAKDDLVHIFERFYRADNARSGDNRSFGLGLSIAKEAVVRLGGQIDVCSSPGVSTCFMVRF